MLLATSACYLVYYTGRQNLGWAIPGLRAELGLTPPRSAGSAALASSSTAPGQLVSGHVADRAGGRRLVALGAVTSCALNWLTSFGGGFWTWRFRWALNGYAQSMGFAPASRLIAAWWAPRERGWAFGVFNFAAGFSSVSPSARRRSCSPGSRGAGCSGCRCSCSSRARPWSGFSRGIALRSSGLHPRPEEDTALGPPRHRAWGARRGHRVRSARVLRAAFSNRAFLFASLGFGFANWARLGLLVWVPSHLLGAGAGRAPRPRGSHWPCRWGWRSAPSSAATPSIGSSAATIRA